MCMVSQDKLIKEGIQYTDKLFDEIIKRLEKGVLDSDTLEEFLRKTKEYTTNNPLVSTDYDKTMLNLILAETNNHKFSRPAQKELVRVTIENQVGDLIRDVGEDIKQSVRDIVTEEYNNPEGSNPQKMAKQISKKVSGIKNKRAKTIARTEIARTATISDYIIASERGATHYTVTCRSTRCPICKKMYCKSSETGGDVEYEITDTSNLPPVHPNCRCSANFFIKEGYKPKTKPPVTEPEPVETPIDTSQMSIKEIAEHYNCDYEMVDLQIGKYAKPKTFHKLTENFEDGRKLSILFEKETLKSYDRVPVNEIIDEIFKVPKVCRNETSQIWFKNNSDGICKRVNKNGIDRIGKNVGGYNTVEYDHRIVINSKFFKTQKKGSEAEWLYNNDGDGGSSSWKKTLHHEFIHSIDYTKTNGGNRRSYNDEKWTEAQRLERWFTPYANTETTEAYAEHGGYYSYMKANPQDHHLVTKIRNNNYEERKITFEEYVKLYPKHVEYFEETLYSNKITLENNEAQIKLRIRELENKISQIEIHIARLENSDPKSLIKQYQQYRDEMLEQIKDAYRNGPRDIIPALQAEYEMYKDKIEELKKADPAKQIKENKKKLAEYKSELQRLKRSIK